MTRLPLALTAFAFVLLAPSLAIANELCNQEMAPLVQERDTLQKTLQDIVARSKQKPGNEALRQEFCGTMKQLSANFTKTYDYFQKNKDFCGVPDEVLTNVKKAVSNQSTALKKSCGPRPVASGGGGPRIPRPPVTLQLR